MPFWRRTWKYSYILPAPEARRLLNLQQDPSCKGTETLSWILLHLTHSKPVDAGLFSALWTVFDVTQPCCVTSTFFPLCWILAFWNRLKSLLQQNSSARYGFCMFRCPQHISFVIQNRMGPIAWIENRSGETVLLSWEWINSSKDAPHQLLGAGKLFRFTFIIAFLFCSTVQTHRHWM